MENILSLEENKVLWVNELVRQNIPEGIIKEMQEDMKKGFPNSVPLIDPTGEYVHQFQLKISIELWRKAIDHFFNK